MYPLMTITLINASIILKKEEYEYSTFPNKVSNGQYSIVTNSNDSVTLRLMTEHDLAMLYEWLNRSHIAEWWAEKKHARHLLTYRNGTCQRFKARVRPPYIAMLNGEPIGYAQSHVALEAGTDGGRRNRPGVPRNRPVTGECITTGQKAWEPSWF